MSGKGKRKDDGAASDADSEGHAPPKKSLKKDSDDDPDSIVVCELSNNRRVSVSSFKGRLMINIREYYLKDGKQMPGRKGISLTMEQWNVLRDHIDEIDKAVSESS